MKWYLMHAFNDYIFSAFLKNVFSKFELIWFQYIFKWKTQFPVKYQNTYRNNEYKNYIVQKSLSNSFYIFMESAVQIL